jgi:hypothetical protein
MILFGENGVVPSLLVFGVTPRYPALSTELPNQKERMEVITAAQQEMNSIIAERRITTALNKNVPSAVDYISEIGSEVLVFREKENSWTGPFIDVKIDDKIITIQNLDNNNHK